MQENGPKKKKKKENFLPMPPIPKNFCWFITPPASSFCTLALEISFFFLPVFVILFFFLIAGFLLPQFALVVAGLEREFKQICGITNLIYLFNFRNYLSHCVRFPLVLCQFFGVAFIFDNNNTAS